MREKIEQRVKQTSLSLIKNSISAIRRKDISKTGFRLIKNSKIAVIGKLGSINEKEENELFAKAENLLTDAVDYPVEPTKNLSHKTELNSLKLTDSELCENFDEILQKLKSQHPDFYISNKVNLTSIDYSITNESNLHLSHSDSFLTVSFLLKENKSTGIMDTFFGITERSLNPDKIIDATSSIISAYQNIIDLPETKLPIIIDQANLTRLFLRDLNGKMVGNKASLFDTEFNKQAFSKEFSLRIANDPDETFSPVFDSEGTIGSQELCVLIDQGVIKRPYTDKRTAIKYGFENTGCASGAYDSVPTLGTCQLEIKPSEKNLKQLLNGQNGILVAIASGGDFTPDGRYATPVQVAYLTDGENLLGRLPEFTISGSIFDFFGKDFIGVAADKTYTAGNEHLAVVNLNFEKL
jgi:PmbA protein